MQAHLQKSEKPRLGPRIQSWIDAIESGTPEATKPKNTRKRVAQQKYNNPRPTKRITRSALALTSGNIMAPPNQQQEELLPSRTRSGRNQPPVTPGKQGRRGTQADEGIREEATPRPGRSQQPAQRPAIGMGPPPFIFPPKANVGTAPVDNAQTPRSESSKSSTERTESTQESVIDIFDSKRSQSPVKKVVDFRMAKKPTTPVRLHGGTAREVGGVLAKYGDLIKLRSGKGVIPRSLQTLIEQNTDGDDWPDEDWYSKAGKGPYEDEMGVQVLKIWQQAWKMEAGERTEPEWNENVHGPLLKLVVNNPKYQSTIECANITSCKIKPRELAMKHINGTTLQKKMIDYAIVLKCDREEEKKIANTIRPMDPQHQSVNQGKTPSICFNPICLNVETKCPFTDGSTADVQMITWTSAGLVKLREMLAANNQGDEAIPTMPLVSFHGHEAHLSALHEEEGTNKYLIRLYLGSTATLPSMFQLIAALDILVDWGNTVYRDWWFEKVAIAQG